MQRWLTVWIVLALLFGVFPFFIFLGLALHTEPCWGDTALSSQVWLIVFAVDMLLSFTVFLFAYAKSCTRIYRSGHSVHWYWICAVIWIFDIVWLGLLSSQIYKFGLADCSQATVVSALVVLLLKCLWTPAAILGIVLGG